MLTTTTDYQLLMRYKHDLRQKWRILFIGAHYDPKQRALISADKRHAIRLDKQNKIAIDSFPKE